MKKSLNIFLLLILFGVNTFAQEQQIIEKKFALIKGKKLDLNLKFAEEIQVNTWEKSEFNFKAIISYSEPGIEKVHTIDINEDSDWLSITTDYDFDAHDPKSWDCNEYNRNYYNKMMYCIKVRYELILPKDGKVRLETIAGNIEVKDFQGELRAKSISGFVDVALPANHPTRLKFRSVTGEIYTDFDVELDENSSAYSKRLTTEINGGGEKLVSLESVSGDIFFRKI